jgi:hypothetical protein
MGRYEFQPEDEKKPYENTGFLCSEGTEIAGTFVLEGPGIKEWIAGQLSSGVTPKRMVASGLFRTDDQRALDIIKEGPPDYVAAVNRFELKFQHEERELTLPVVAERTEDPTIFEIRVVG